MNPVNKKINEIINFSEVIERIKKLEGKKEDKEIAKIFGLSNPDLNNRMKRGTLLPQIIIWAVNEKVNLDWLLTGQEPEKAKLIPEVAGEIEIIEKIRLNSRFREMVLDILKGAIKSLSMGSDSNKWKEG